MIPDLAVVIVAGGSARRFGGDKLMVNFGGLPLFLHSVKEFLPVAAPGSLVVVHPAGRKEEFARQAELFLPGSGIVWAAGGACRSASVRSGLDATPRDLPLVAVHDAARPLIEVGQIEECVAAVRADESLAGAILAARSVDTLKLVEGTTIVATPDRSFYWAAQTPQVFRRRVLLAAHKAAAHEDYQGTDDASLVERLGGKVRVVESTRDNIKITLPEDLALAEATLERRLLT